MTTGLSGSVRRLHIQSAYGETGGLATYEGFPVHVKYAGKFVGQDCLVKFDIANTRGGEGFIASFVSTQKKDVVLSLREYILLGLWEDDMQRKGELPSVLEVNRYYDPSDARMIMYIASDSKQYFLTPGGRTIDKNKCSLERFIKDETPPNLPRVLVTESRKILETVRTKTAKRSSLTPLTMQRIDKLSHNKT